MSVEFPQPRGRETASERHAYRVPAGARVDGLFLARDGSASGMAVVESGRRRLLIDGALIDVPGTVDAIQEPAAGSLFAFRSHTADGQRAHVGHAVFGPFALVVGSSFEPPDFPSAWVFQVKREDGQWTVLCDGVLGAWFEAVHQSVALPCAPWVAYVGSRGDARWLVIGDRILGPFDDVSLPATDAAGRRVAYAFRRGEEWFVQFGDDELGPFAGEVSALALDAAGQHVAFAVAHARRTHVFVDETEQLQCTNLRRDLHVTPDGQLVTAYDDRGDCFVFDRGVQRGPYDYAEGPYVDGTRHRVAWAAWHAGLRGNEGFGLLGTDGTISEIDCEPDWESGDSFGFLPDGRFGFIARDRESNETSLWIGGETIGPIELASFAGRQITGASDGRWLVPVRANDAIYAYRDTEVFGPFAENAVMAMNAAGELAVVEHVPSSDVVSVLRWK
jgi:hypothetical protein